MRAATGQFIHDLAAWTWWGTLSFAHAVARDRAIASFKLWLRQVAMGVAHDHVTAAWAFEGAATGHPHFHVLLELAPELRTRDIRIVEALWRGADSRAGITWFRRFDASKGAAWYQVKTDDWGVTVGCPRGRPCRRQRGCIVAPGSY